MPSGLHLVTGTADFSSGVDSGRTSTVVSVHNPNGLPYSGLAWLNNGTVRGGSIGPRPGWVKLCTVAPAGSGLYQSGLLYESAVNPYLVLSIGGQIMQVRVDTDNSVVNLSQLNGNLVNPASVTKGYMCQAEQFLVIQAGDWGINNVGTLPLFWDGNNLRRSAGIISANNVPGNTGSGAGLTPFNELPAAQSMVYYQGRIFYAQGRTYAAGDIVGGAAGTKAYNQDDSVLKVTENPLAIGGDGFRVPSQAGNITGMSYVANENATLGQGLLYIFTRRQIYSLAVPISRNDWINATGSNQPQQIVVQRKFGAVSDRCIVPVNGDLFYQTPEPAVRSLSAALRYVNQWANLPISRAENRLLRFNQLNAMGSAPGVLFDNRLYMAGLPVQTTAGLAYQAMAPLDFDIISTYTQGQQPLTPAWEGMTEGLDILDLFEGDFNGIQRMFAIVHSRLDDSIQVWEQLGSARYDNGDNRITFQIESPAYEFGKFFALKKLDGGELWLDRIAGTIDVRVEYRVDADPCWQLWYEKQFCAARSTCEDLVNPVCYPLAPYCEGQKFPMVLPAPQEGGCVGMSSRPPNIGYQFQLRITIQGACRVKAVWLYAQEQERPLYEGLNDGFKITPKPTKPTACPPGVEQTCGTRLVLHGFGAPTSPPEVTTMAALYIDDNTAAIYSWIVVNQAWL